MDSKEQKNANKKLSEYAMEYVRELTLGEAYDMLVRNPEATVYAYQHFLGEVCRMKAGCGKVYVGDWSRFCPHQLVDKAFDNKFDLNADENSEPRNYYKFFQASVCGNMETTPCTHKKCFNICPHCGKCTKEKKETIPDTAEEA